MATSKQVQIGIQADTAGAKKMVAALTQVRASMEDLSSSAEANMQILSSNMTTTWTKGGKEINKFTNIVQDNLGNTFRQVTKSVAGETPELMSQSFKQISKSAYAELSATSQQFKNFGNIAAQSNEDILKSAGFFGKSIRNDIGKPVALVSSEVENHLTAQGDAVRRVSAVWKDEFGKTVNTVYQQSASGTKAISAGFVKVKEAVSNIPTGPISQMGDSMQRLQFAVKGVGGVSAESFQLIRGNLQTTQKGVELFTETFTNKLGQKVVITSQKTAQGLVPISKNIDTIGKSAEKSFQQMNDFQKALRRMALVVPVWMAGRAAIQAVFTTIKEGVRTITDYEKAMARATVMSSDLTDSTKQLSAVQEQTRRLTLETGIEFGKAAEGYTLLKTAGIDYETSLKSQEIILKTAVGLMGDVEAIATSSADIYNVLGDTITGTSSEYEKFAVILGTGAKLYQQNAFEFNEFAEAMKKSAGISQTAGVTFQQQAAILAAFAQVGLRGAEGATALRQSLVFLSKQPNVVKDLIKVDPKDLSTIEILKSVFQSLFDLIQSGQRGQALKFAEELFGVRGIKTTALSTSQGMKTLLKDLEDVAQIGYSEGFGLINKNFKTVNNTSGEQIKILERVRGELGKTFFEGITGTNDFKAAVVDLRQTLQTLQPGVQGLGIVLKTNLIDPLLFIPRVLDNVSVEGQVGWVKQYSDDMLLFNKLIEDFDKNQAEKLLTKFKRIASINPIKEAFERTENIPIQQLIDKLESAIANKGFISVPVAFEVQKVPFTAEQIRNLKKQFPNVSIEGEEAIAGLYTGREPEENQATKDTLSSLQKMVEHRIKLLQLQGATTAEQLKAQAALEKSLFGQTRIQTLLDRQLETERKINEQKKEQYGYSSDSLKLMEISQTYGLKVAEEIGKVLQTGATPADLSTGARRVYESQFADKYQQYKAEEFFTRGAGRGINIEERGLAETGQVLTRDTSGALTAQTARGVINAPISMPVSIQVNTDAVIGKVEQSILKEIRNPNSELAKQLKEFNEKYL